MLLIANLLFLVFSTFVSRMVSAHLKHILAIFTKIAIQDFWVNSFLGIVFGYYSFIADWPIASWIYWVAICYLVFFCSIKEDILAKYGRIIGFIAAGS